MFGIDTSTISSLFFEIFVILSNVANSCALVFDTNSFARMKSWSLTHRLSYQASWKQSTNARNFVAWWMRRQTMHVFIC